MYIFNNTHRGKKRIDYNIIIILNFLHNNILLFCLTRSSRGAAHAENPQNILHHILTARAV